LTNDNISTTPLLISVILANYNHGHYLEDNLNGLLAQTYPHWELILVDDASTDNSREIIAHYAALDSRIKPFYLPNNNGAIAAFNLGFDKIKGELCYGSAADDYICNPKFFELVTDQLQQHPDAAGVSLKTLVINAETGEELWDMGVGKWRGYLGPNECLMAFFEENLFIPGSSSIWKASLVKQIGYHEDLGPQCDYFVNHVLPALSGVCFVDEIAITMRKAADNFSAKATDEEFFVRHALVEHRLREACSSQIILPEVIENWRFSLINSRLAITRQELFISTTRDFYQQIQPWEADSLSKRFASCREYLIEQMDALEIELREQRTHAEAIFKRIAGD
jgi:glycosyltransferase involved in cell wall biosynthesis